MKLFNIEDFIIPVSIVQVEMGIVITFSWFATVLTNCKKLEAFQQLVMAFTLNNRMWQAEMGIK